MEHSSHPDRRTPPVHWDAVDDALTNPTPGPTAQPDAALSATLRDHLCHSPETPGDLDAGFEALLSRIDARSDHSSVPRSAGVQGNRFAGRMANALRSHIAVRRPWIALAVTLGVTAAGIVAIAVAGRHRLAGAGATLAARQYSTTAGERASVTLADGSQAMLGPSSTLRVAPGFGLDTRAVDVRGTVFFAVAHAESAPFVVTAGDARIRVLGTAFAVRRYDSDTAVVIAVQSGRIAVGATAAAAGTLPLVAQANEVAMVARGRASVHPSSGDVDRLTAWTRGRLQFEDTPLRDALPELERWYDVSFQLSDSSLAALRVSGGFQSQGIGELEETLRYILPVTVRRNGRIITLSR